MKGLTRNITLAVLAVVLSACSGEEQSEDKLVKVKVQTSKPVIAMFQDKIRVQGNIEPVEHAEICSRIDGTLDELFVSEGSQVKAGEVLFQVDKSNLENEVRISKQNLKVAESNREKVRIDIEVSLVYLEKAEIDFRRAENLIGKNAISQDQFEEDNLALKKAKASVSQRKAELKHRDALVEQAKGNLDIALKRLSDSMAKAPFTGVVTHKYREVGEYVNRGDRILRVEDPDNLELSIILGAKYYARTVPGRTVAKIYSLEGEHLVDSVVNYRSPSIDPDSRTYELTMKAPHGNGLVSGMLCNVDLILLEREGISVPTAAVLTRSGGRKVVFTVSGGKAKEVEVRQGIAADGSTEILNGQNIAGMDIVVKGQTFLDSGSSVQVLPEE